MTALIINELGVGGWALAAAMLVVVLAAVVQRTTGMGFGQVAAPLLLLIDKDFVPAAVILMGIGVSIYAAVRDRAGTNYRQVSIALLGRFAGTLAAGWLLVQWIDTELFSLMFGAMVLLAVLISLRRWNVAVTPTSLLVAGTCSGFVGTVTSIGAPPMGLIYQNTPGPQVRGTLNLFFAIGAAFSVLILWLNGILDRRDILLALVLLPGLLGGSLLAGRLTGFVDRRFRPVVLGICGTSGAIILLRAIF